MAPNKRRSHSCADKDDSLKQCTLDSFFKKNAKIAFVDNKTTPTTKKKRTRNRTESCAPVAAVSNENSRVELVVERQRKLPYSTGSPDSENKTPFKLCFNRDGEASVEVVKLDIEDECSKTMFVNKPKVQQWNYEKNRPRILENIVLNMPQNAHVSASTTNSLLSVKSFQSDSGVFEGTTRSDNVLCETVDITGDSDDEKPSPCKRASLVDVSENEPVIKKSCSDLSSVGNNNESLRVSLNSFTSDELFLLKSTIKRRYSEDTVILDENFEQPGDTTEREINEIDRLISNTSRDADDKLYVSKSNDNLQKLTDNNTDLDATEEVYENNLYRNIRYFKEIVDCLKTDKLLILLPANEIDLLEKFFEMKKDYQVFCYKLYTRKHNWLNIFDFCKLVKLDMSEECITKMYKYLSSTDFIKTDYMSEDLSKLLHLLRLPDVKSICGNFRIKVAKKDKETMINKLLNNCNKQCTLSTSNTENLLRQCIRKKLGSCVKISAELVNAFYHAYVLYSFTNPDLEDVASINLFMYRLENTEIVLPGYNKSAVSVFSDTDEFLRFSKAYECRIELLKAVDNKNTTVMLELCQFAYEEFRSIVNSKAVGTKIKFLSRFTPGAKYASVLTIGSKHLSKSEPKEVCKWLKLLIGQDFYCQHKRGFWYDQLIMVQMYHLKQFENAKDTLIKGLKDASLSEIAKYDLSVRGTVIKNNMKKFKLDKADRDAINFLLKPKIERVPECEIDAKGMRSNVSGKKRMYEVNNANGDRTFMTVEEIAIDHYKRLGYKGMHCESALLTNLFFVLFWDIIYEHDVEGAFISSVQYYPLDLFTEDFYANRQKVIKRRLEEVSGVWSEDKLMKHIDAVLEEHSHEKSLLVETFVSTTKQLCCIVACIGRKKLAKILKRLIENFGLYRSGVPDLFLWDTHKKVCKFVEVKGENDRLSINQKLWLAYLKEVGVDVEVCYVHSHGSKRRSLKKD